MSLSRLSRYAFFALCVLLALGSLPFLQHEWAWPVALVSGALSVVGIVDLAQTRQAVRRNYPVVGNIRYLVEAIRPRSASTCSRATVSSCRFSAHFVLESGFFKEKGNLQRVGAGE